MPETMLKKAKKSKKRTLHNVRAAMPDTAIPARHGTRGLGTAADLTIASSMVAQGVARTNPEVAATIVSESIGEVLTMRREARAKGDNKVVGKLSDRLAQLVELRDLVHSGNEEAINSVLSGARS